MRCVLETANRVPYRSAEAGRFPGITIDISLGDFGRAGAALHSSPTGNVFPVHGEFASPTPGDCPLEPDLHVLIDILLLALWRTPVLALLSYISRLLVWSITGFPGRYTLREASGEPILVGGFGDQLALPLQIHITPTLQFSGRRLDCTCAAEKIPDAATARSPAMPRLLAGAGGQTGGG